MQYGRRDGIEIEARVVEPVDGAAADLRGKFDEASMASAPADSHHIVEMGASIVCDTPFALAACSGSAHLRRRNMQGTAHPVSLLEHHNPGAGPNRLDGAGHACCAGADDDQIHI